MQLKSPSKADITIALTRAFEKGDLQFIEMVHNLAYGYKVELKRNQKDKCTEDI